MKINYFNTDHTHALIDLPTSLTIEQGNTNSLKAARRIGSIKAVWLKVGFARGRGYGVFLVSHSDVDRVANYIARQEENHRKRTFAKEYEVFIEKYGLK